MFREKRLKLRKKTFVAQSILLLNFYNRNAWPKDSLFFIIIEGREKNKNFYRSYCPLRFKDNELFLLLKYRKKGLMSNFLKNLTSGTTMRIAKTIILLKLKLNMKRKIGMIAGGTGITAMWQLLIFFSRINCRTEIRLIWANVCPENLICLDKLIEITSIYSNLKILYLLENHSINSSFEKGIVNKINIQKFIGNPEVGKSVFVCGPPRMNLSVFADLHQLGFSTKNIIKF